MNPQITAEEFDELVSKTHLQDQGVGMARAVLVDGRGYSNVAHELGVSRQLVYQAVQRFLAATASQPEVYEYHGSPGSFVEVDAIVDKYSGRKMLTLSQFEELVPLTRLAPHSIELARGVLVDGLTNIELAKTHGIARHLPWQAATRLMKHFDSTMASVRVYKGSADMFAAIDALSERSPKGKRK